MSALTAHIRRVALLGPGLPGWEASLPVLRGEQPHAFASTQIPAPQQLPPAERRRAGQAVRLVLALSEGIAAGGGVELAGVASVFSSSGGDGHNCHALCETLASSDPLISPTRFHNSVHNAAAGYWSIASQATGPCSILAGFDASFGAGLLEALALLANDPRPVLLMSFEGDYPQPLRATRPIPDAFGCALLLERAPAPDGLGRLSLQFDGGAADRLADPGLEALRQAIPAGRALPLLQCLARREAGEVVVDYLDGLRLRLAYAPC